MADLHYGHLLAAQQELSNVVEDISIGAVTRVRRVSSMLKGVLL